MSGSPSVNRERLHSTNGPADDSAALSVPGRNPRIINGSDDGQLDVPRQWIKATDNLSNDAPEAREDDADAAVHGGVVGDNFDDMDPDDSMGDARMDSPDSPV